MSWFFGCFAAYVIGGIPFGLVLVRWFVGVDIRTIGSGNVGATNASRAFSKKRQLPVFLLIYVLDFLKGFVPTFWFASWLGVREDVLLASVVFGVAAVIGHCASPFLRLRGGKGVATTTGVFAAVELVPLAIAIGVFGIVFASTKKVYLGSLALGLALASAIVLRDTDSAFAERLPVSVAAIAAAVFLVWTHRSNIKSALGARTGAPAA